MNQLDRPTKRATQDKTSRRELFRALGRGAGLLALGGLAWRLGFRTKKDRAGNDGRLALCRRCSVLPFCSRPESALARDALGVRTRPQEAGRVGPALRPCESKREARKPPRGKG